MIVHMPIGNPILYFQTVHIPINNSILYLQIVQILVGFSKHPDRERKLEVRVRNSASLVEYTFNRFLWP